MRGRLADGGVDHDDCRAAAGDGDGSTSAALNALVQRLVGAGHQPPAARLAVLPVRGAADRMPDCARCTDSCCVAPNLVKLTLRDIARLHDAGLGWAVGRSTPEGAAADRDEASRPGAADGVASLKNIDARCVFLDPADRCAVHAIRPRVCRAYPYQVAPDRDHVRRSAGCRSELQAPDPEGGAALVADALGVYDERVDDLLLLADAAQELIELGLDGYLPHLRPAPSTSFAARLASRRGGD